MLIIVSHHSNKNYIIDCCPTDWIRRTVQWGQLLIGLIQILSRDLGDLHLFPSNDVRIGQKPRIRNQIMAWGRPLLLSNYHYPKISSWTNTQLQQNNKLKDPSVIMSSMSKTATSGSTKPLHPASPRHDNIHGLRKTGPALHSVA